MKKGQKIDKKTEKEKIEILEKIPTSTYNRMCLVLTYFGEKPCSYFDFKIKPSKENPLENLEIKLKVDEIRNKIRDVGLKSKIIVGHIKYTKSINYIGKKPYFVWDYRYSIGLIVGKDQKKIQELYFFLKKQDN